MTESNKELYRKYQENTLSSEEFSAFKKEMSHLSDDELWSLMSDSDLSFEEEELLEDSIKEQQMEELQEIIGKQRRFKMLRYAAAILVLFVSGVSYYLYSKFGEAPANFTQVVVESGDKAKILLPDGTRVSMNSNTILAYDVKKGDHRRVSIVKGEAYFDVTKDPKCPFHVSVGDMNIQVLGTTFNVKAEESRVETSLFTGSVKLTINHQDQEYWLIPGQKSIFEKGNLRVQITKNDPSYDAGWKDGYLVFRSEPLKDVLKKIENWYGVNIQLDATKMQSDILTGSFHNETLPSVLKTLSLQYGFRYENHGNTIIIKNNH